LDTLLTHRRSDGVKLDRRLPIFGLIVTILDLLCEKGFAFFELEEKEFYSGRQKKKIFSILLIKKEIFYAAFNGVFAISFLILQV
jgi:hypothetical protein